MNFLDIELLQVLQQHGRIRANHLVNLLSILVEQKRRHGADAQLLTQLWQLIHVELDKVDFVLELCFLRGSIVLHLSLVPWTISIFLTNNDRLKRTFPGWEQWPCTARTRLRSSPQ